MPQQADLLNIVNTLPQKYISEVLNFIGYLQNKAQQEAAEQAAAEKEQRAAREKAAFIKYADELNAEAEDVLLDQDLDSFEEDLKRLSPHELAVLRATAVAIT